MRNNSTSRATKSPGLWYANAMEQLVEVVQQLSLARKLETIMDIVRKAARELTEADGAIFVLRDGDRCFYAEKDAIAPLSKGQRFPMSACICSWAMLNGKSAVIEDIYADPRIPADAYRPTFVKSLAMVPIRTVQPVGAIGIYWTKQHRPCPEQVKIIQALADTTAVAMENVNVYSELEIRVNQRTFELQAILDNVQAGIIFSVNEKIVRTNPKSAEIFHLDEKAMIGMRTEKLFRSKAFHNAVTQLSEGKVFDTETMIILQDGTESWVRMIAKSLDSAPGSEIWVINDIGEAKAREKVLDELRIEAEAAARFKSRFLATMSHEIRTPLTGMLGMLELLSMTHLDNEQRSTMNAAWNSGRGLLSIVNDILDWSKIEERKLALSPRSTSIPQLLHESVNTYSRIAIAKGLLLKEKSDPQLSAAYFVDPLRLSQIINNFVSNAIKFTDHGNVELRAELVNHLECGDRIRISVRDTGIGISKDVQKRLFQRYSQESADTARVYGGTGLGLSICRRLADLMDGKIDLESEPGQGSTFSIMLVLPISAAQGEAPAIPHLEIEQKFIEPLLESEDDVPVVLAVDDHPINRELLCRQIRLLGLRADSAENGIAALDMWRNGRYALVITDCHMPEMDGYSFAREIRKIEQADFLSRTPVIAWTANALAEESERCRKAGIDDLLVKPADMKQLRKILAKWLVLKTNNQKTDSPIDRGLLNAIVKDEDSQRQLLNEFLRHVQSEQEKLSAMFDRGSLQDIANTAHRMKGSSRLIGANNLADACEKVEQAAKDGDMAKIFAAKIVLDNAISRVELFITKGING